MTFILVTEPLADMAIQAVLRLQLQRNDFRYRFRYCFMRVCLFLPDILSSWLHLPLPANLVGMMLMLTLILCRVIPLNWVRAGARWLLAEMLLFFVPAVVAVVNYAQLLMVDGWRTSLRSSR